MQHFISQFCFFFSSWNSNKKLQTQNWKKNSLNCAWKGCLCKIWNLEINAYYRSYCYISYVHVSFLSIYLSIYFDLAMFNQKVIFQWKWQNSLQWCTLIFCPLKNGLSYHIVIQRSASDCTVNMWEVSSLTFNIWQPFCNRTVHDQQQYRVMQATQRFVKCCWFVANSCNS